MADDTIGLRAIMDLAEWNRNYGAYLADLRQLTGQTTEASKKTTSGFGDIAKAAAMVGTAIGAAKIAGALSSITQEAAKLDQVRSAFAGITGGSDEVLDALQRSSSGMVRDADLMKSYNLAAQLVSKTFADQLPQAMGYLQKVAASTGQSMDYMMESLVRGVGRLSPMILDNLSIQVDLTTANQNYAESVGKTAESLTKAEKQTAVMNMVMQKLAENTAAMPAVAGTAQAQFAAFQTTLVNLRDELGGKLVPVLTAVTNTLGQAVTTDAMKTAMDAVGVAAQGLAGTVGELAPAFLDFAGNALPKVLDGLSGILRFGGDVVTVLEKLDLGVLAATAAAIPLATGIFQVIQAVKGMGTAMAVLNGIMAANPILLIATGIIAAGLAIARVVDAVKTKNAEMATAAEAQNLQVMQSTSTYEDYMAKRMEFLRQQNDLPARYSDEALAINSVRDGLMMTRQEYEQYALTLTSQVKPSMDSVQASMDADAQAFSEVGTAIPPVIAMIDALANGTYASFEGMTGTMAEYEGEFLDMVQVVREGIEATKSMAMAEAFFSPEVVKGQEAFEKVTENHYAKLEDMAAEHQKDQVNRQFDYNLERAQAEQQYQAERQVLGELGKADEIAQLDAKYGEQKTAAEAAYSVQSQLAERSYLQQQAQQAQAYYNELVQQRDQNIRLMVAQLTANEKFQQLDQTAQDAMIATLYLGGSVALQNEYKRAQARLTLEHEVTKGIGKEAQAQVDFWVAQQAETVEAAQAGLDAANKRVSAFKIELPKPDFGAIRATYTAAGGAAGSAAGSAAGKTATKSAIKAISEEMAALNKAITDSMEAIMKLQSFEVPVGIEIGLGRFKEFAKLAMLTVDAAIKEMSLSATRIERATSFATALSGIMKAIQESLEAIQALAKWEDRQSVATQMTDLIARLDEIVPVMERSSRKMDQDGLVKAQAIFDAMGGILGFVKGAIEGVTALAEWKPTRTLGETAQALAARLDEVIPVLVDLSRHYRLDGLTAAKAILSAASGVLSFVGDAVKAIVALSELRQVDSLEDTVTMLRERMGEIVPALVETADEYEQEGLDAAASIYKSMNDIIGWVDEATEAVTALADWRVPSVNVATQVQVLIDQVIRIVGQLVLGVTELIDISDPQAVADLEALNTVTAKLWKGIFDLVATTGKSIESLVKLSTWNLPAERLSDKVRILMDQVVRVAGQLVLGAMELVDISNNTAVDDLARTNENVSKIWTGLMELVEPIKGAVDALTGLSSYVRSKGDIGAIAWDFGNDLQRAVAGLQAGLHGRPARGGGTQPEIVAVEEAAKLFFESTEGIVDQVGPAIEMLGNLFRYRGYDWNLVAQAERFGSDLNRMLLSLTIGIRGGAPGEIGNPPPLWQLEDDARRFWEGVGVISDVVMPALEALAALLSAPTYDPANMEKRATSFGQAILAVASALVAAKGTLDTEVYEAAAAFYASVRGIIEVVSTGMEALTSLQPKDKKDKGWDATLMETRATNFAAAVLAVASALDVARAGATAPDLADTLGFWSALQSGLETVANIIRILVENQTLSVAKATAQMQFNLGIIEKDIVAMLGRLGRLLPLAAQFAAEIGQLQSSVMAGIGLAEKLGTTQALGDPWANLKNSLRMFLADPPQSILDGAYALGWSMGKQIEEGLRAATETHSPSRVMERLGADWRVGLQRGWSQAQVPYQGAPTTNNYQTQTVSLAISANVASDIDIDKLGQRVLQVVAKGMKL